VATDIAARGIDIDQLPFVIILICQIYLKPMYIELEELVAGNGGVAISFCSKDEHGYWKDIQN
jgi:ATP-dependent RNA helicase RhlE